MPDADDNDFPNHDRLFASTEIQSQVHYARNSINLTQTWLLWTI